MHPLKDAAINNGFPDGFYKLSAAVLPVGPLSKIGSVGKRFAAFLKKRRKDLGLTQEQVARSLGYSNPQQVDLWEKGIEVPPEESLKNIIDLYQITLGGFVTWLLKYRGNKASVTADHSNESIQQQTEEMWS